jgi:hypothetical protein
MGKALPKTIDPTTERERAKIKEQWRQKSVPRQAPLKDHEPAWRDPKAD